MSHFEELQELKKNVSSIHDPIILFHMNQKARVLEDKIKNLKTKKVYYELVEN